MTPLSAIVYPLIAALFVAFILSLIVAFGARDDDEAALAMRGVYVAFTRVFLWFTLGYAVIWEVFVK